MRDREGLAALVSELVIIIGVSLLLDFLLGALWQLHGKRTREPSHRCVYAEWEDAGYSTYESTYQDRQVRRCVVCNLKQVHLV